MTGGAHAARDTRAFINHWNLAWKIPISEFSYQHNGQNMSVPYLKPRDVFKFLLLKAPELLFGGSDTISGQKSLRAYWLAYKQTHGQHEVFTHHPNSLGTCLPVALHGDEGRGVRKGNTCIMTLESVLGLDTAWNIHKQEHYGACCSCKSGALDLNQSAKTHGRSASLANFQETNLKHHCFLSKFVLCLLPNDLYKDGSDLVMLLLQEICAQLRQLFFEGIYCLGRVWTLVVVGFKGDLAWFAKVGRLSRCYNRLSEVSCMCHECHAGTIEEPFEDMQEEPTFARSLYASRPRESAPVFNRLPFEKAAPERILRRDLFHNTKVGVWRDFVGSAIMLLCHLGIFHQDAGPGVSNARKVLLQRAHGHFRLYCLGAGKKPALRSFTKDFLNAKKVKAFPWINAKGSDASILVQWLCVATLGFMNTHPQHAEILKKLRDTAYAAKNFLAGLYRHGLWLERGCATAMALLSSAIQLPGSLGNADPRLLWIRIETEGPYAIPHAA